MRMTDTELAGQPAAYWTGMAYEALIAFTRARQGEHGFTQPQFWLLRNLSVNDLNPGGGRTLDELRHAMATYLRAEDDLAAEAEILVERGWLRLDEDSGRLWITDAGETTLADMKKYVPEIRRRIHEGIDDADYVTTLRVLQRMMENTSR